MDEVKTCSICGKTFVGWGNNPWPITIGENDRCCDECNLMYVIPARLGVKVELPKKEN